jgi:transcriptional regulator with XRE-family HTH domain
MSKKEGMLALRKEFGWNVRQMRHRHDWSQIELAEKANLHPTYISSMEAGKRNATLEVIVKLTRALNCSSADIIPK